MRCQQCGAANRAAARFCDQCGTRLAGAGTMPTGGIERRQLTVMFCDLVDSSALGERFDPEELRPLIEAYQEVAGEAIAHLGGHVAQYLGDGLLVYFGYPHAEEDDARRAVRAGLDVLAAVERLNGRLAAEAAVRLAVRVGIHTGTVVVGEMGGAERREHLALGGTLNVAARLQAVAVPGSVVLSDATRRLAPRAFRYAPLGPQALKGISTPVLGYRVIGEPVAAGAIDGTAGLTPFVGRDDEIALLVDRWERTRRGTGQVVLLEGEAGIGKSRLGLELRERVATTPHLALQAVCVPHGRGSPLHPFVDLLERSLSLGRNDPPPARFATLESAVRRAELPLAEAVPLLCALLSIPLAGEYRPLGLGAERQRRRTHEILLALLRAPAQAKPLLLVVEDLHWADPSTLELLGRLLESTGEAPVLTLLTHRPEFRPPWTTGSHCSVVTLGRLSPAHARLMVARVAGDLSLTPALVDQLVARTDGVPLFIEELTKMVLEAGAPRDGAALDAAIPATLRDSLMARLDRLGPAKEIAQLAAAVGREVPLVLLRAIAPLDGDALDHALARIVDAEVLVPDGGAEPTYVFKHTLIQEAAYDSLLRTTRQEHHRRIAEALEASQPDVGETRPELLAHHYTEAGRATEATRWWRRAAEKALERSADAEAAAHAMRGLGLLVGCEESTARDQQELLLQTTLGAALMVTEGYASPRVERAYGRARALCQRVGETPRLFSILRGLYVPYLLQGKLQVAHELAEQLLRIARSGDDVPVRVEANFALGQTLLFRGEFDAARDRLEEGVALHRHVEWRSHAFRYGQDSAVSCAALAAHALQALGYPDRARAHGDQAVDLARTLSHPGSLAAALFFLALLLLQRREPARAREHAAELLTLAEEQGLAFWAGGATALLGATADTPEEAIAQMQEGLTALRIAGAHLLRPLLLPLLADAHGRAGRVEDGLRIIDDALFVVTQNGELITAAELHRVKGELLRMRGAADAEASLRHALEIARGQRARGLELRGAVSLARLVGASARPQLAETYASFGEGFETADLREAAATLRALA